MKQLPLPLNRYCFNIVVYLGLVFSFTHLSAEEDTKQKTQNITDNVVIRSQLTDEEADEVLSFLKAKGIQAEKVTTRSRQLAAVSDNSWEVHVSPFDAVEAVVSLDEAHIPPKKSHLLFDEYLKRMRENRETNIAYDNLAEQVVKEVKALKGVRNVEVFINYIQNDEDENGAYLQATVYVSHTGVLDDPQGNFAEEIKHLVASKIDGLDEKHIVLISERDVPSVYEKINPEDYQN